MGMSASQARLNQKDKQLDNQILKLEQELKVLEAEYDQIGSALDSAAKSSAPQYVA